MKIIDSLGHALFLLKQNLSKGSYQVSLKQEDRQKTAYVAPWGKYQYWYMAIG